MHEDNHLITKPIGSLIKSIAIPASVGFFFQTMFNVTDTFYAGFLSTEALAALSLSFPIFFIIVSLSSGIQTGATALIANALGEGKLEEAKKLSAQTISFGVILSVLVTIIGLVLSPTLFRILGASETYLSLSLSYINIIFLGSVTFIMLSVINASLNAIGNTTTFRNFLIFGFFLNILLDPWFMFGGLGFPKLGIAGVAIATILVQIFGVLYLIAKARKTKLFTGAKAADFAPRFHYLKEISRQSVPASINMMTVGLGIFIITYFISNFGQDAVAAYGIATRIEQIFLLPTIGLTIATLTLVGQNNGALRYDRVLEAVHTASRAGLYIMTAGTIIIFLGAKLLISVFTKDPSVIALGAFYLRIAAFITWAYAILFINISVLQGLKRPMFALWIGLFRQIIAPIFVFWLLSKVLGWGISGIWWGVFIVTWTATIITVFYARSVLAQLRSDKN